MHQVITSSCSHRTYRCTASQALGPSAARSRGLKVVAHGSTAASEGTARPKVVLGIESSCDDTGVAVVTTDGRVLGEAIASQHDITAQWGGVVPSLAMAAHREAIDRVVDEALAKAGITPSHLDAVAVTVGPGLSLCLRVGASKALSLSAAHQIPLVRVHHMEAHALVARAVPDGPNRPAFPFLCLLVSGGHNLLVLVRGVGSYVQLGTTLDDALGEAFDKVARLLGLELKPSGGAVVEALAREGDPRAFKFKVPMRQRPNCDFSYAGLKTSVRLAIEANVGIAPKPIALQQQAAERAAAAAVAAGAAGMSAGGVQAAAAAGTQATPAAGTQAAAAAAVHSTVASGQSHAERAAGSDGASTSGRGPEEEAAIRKVKADICASFQSVATTHLIERVSRGIGWAREYEPGLKTLVVAGGVACNQHIRSELDSLAQQAGLELMLPPPKYCTDNGVMVAWAGIERMKLGLTEAPPSPGTEISDDTWIDLWPRWPLTSELHPKCLDPTGTAGVPHGQQAAGAAATAAATYAKLSTRKARMQTSLTEMTAAELASKSGAQQGRGAGVPAA